MGISELISDENLIILLDELVGVAVERRRLMIYLE